MPWPLFPHDVEFVAVHDAVRPLATNDLIDAVFAAAKANGAAIPALPVADTLKRANADNTIVETVSARRLVSSPDATSVSSRMARGCLCEASRLCNQPFTDDSQLVEVAGYPVTIVNGSPSNFKITTRDDLTLAEMLVKNRTTREPEKPLASFHDEAKW